MITHEQVVDLQPGDVVRFRFDTWPQDTFVQGSLEGSETGALLVAGHFVRYDKDRPHVNGDATLIILARKSRPIYVNHPRTEPAAGDVVRNADDDDDTSVWLFGYTYENDEMWMDAHRILYRDKLPQRLRLLVDGETGKVTDQ